MDKIGVVGLGLIGGSIALALKANGYYVLGVDNNDSTLKYAIDNSIIDESVSLENLKGCSVIFVCVPIQFTLDTINKIYSVVGDSAIITDVASVKGILKNAKGRIVGGHPMAGTEKSGIYASKSHLFENAFYILVQYNNTTDSDYDIVKNIISKFKAKIINLSYIEHDKQVASISHLPHTIAYSLVNSAYKENAVVGTGFLDTTRIASSNPDFWTYVTMYNKDNILNEMNLFLDKFTTLRDYIIENDKENIYNFYNQAVVKRKILQNTKVYQSEYSLDIDVVDEVGSISKISAVLSKNNININAIAIINSREGIGGALRLNFASEKEYSKAKKLLIKENE